MDTLHPFVMEIDDLHITVGDGQGGTFQVSRADIDYMVNGGGTTERQYLVYQIAVGLKKNNVVLGDNMAVAQFIDQMTLEV